MPGNGITPEEKVRARHHTAHLNVAPAFAFVLGTPAAVETQFAIESAFDKVLVEAVPLFRQILATMDTIEAQKVEDLDVLVAAKVGTIDLRPDEQHALDQQYRYWQGKLCNLLGVPFNPFDKSMGPGINVAVFS